jgi:hypothetical protein
MPLTVRPIAVALSISLMTLMTVSVATQGAFAQNNQAEPAQEAPKQMALTDKQIDDVLAAKADIDAIVNKLPQNAQPSPKVVAELDAAARKHGFASYAQYDDVAGNISMVMDGFDPQTKKYIGPEAVIKEEIAQVQADKKMSPRDRKEALDQLNDEMKSVTPLQFPGNIAVVTKHFDQLSAAMSQGQ